MEKKLFSWGGWDGDVEMMSFYDVVLKVKIGEYQPGETFSSAYISYLNGELSLYRNLSDENPEAIFKLSFLVGEKVIR